MRLQLPDEYVVRKGLRRRAQSRLQSLCHDSGNECSAAKPRDTATVALTPVCFPPVFHVERHTTALELGAMAQSLTGLPASALIPSASCVSFCAEKRKPVCAHVCHCILRDIKKQKDEGKILAALSYELLSVTQSNGTAHISSVAESSVQNCTFNLSHIVTSERS